MNLFQLSIVLSDEALAAALARAVAKEYPYVQVTVGETENADFTIRDEFLGTPAPVREIMDRVLALCGRDFSFVPREDTCPFTAFTAGGGGRGVSACAGLYASFQASGNKRVLLLSLDPYAPPTDPQAGMALLKKVTAGTKAPLKAACIEKEESLFVPAQSGFRNLLHQLDAEDAAAFFRSIEDSGEWDEVVLDVPRAYGFWEELMEMCETRVVVVSADPLCGQMDEAAFLQLQRAAERAMDRPPRTVRFAPAQDASARAGQPDLYSQLGCEVSALAQQLALQ